MGGMCGVGRVGGRGNVLGNILGGIPGGGGREDPGLWLGFVCLFFVGRMVGWESLLGMWWVVVRVPRGWRSGLGRVRLGWAGEYCQ